MSFSLRTFSNFEQCETCPRLELHNSLSDAWQYCSTVLHKVIQSNNQEGWVDVLNKCLRDRIDESK